MSIYPGTQDQEFILKNVIWKKTGSRIQELWSIWKSKKVDNMYFIFVYLLKSLKKQSCIYSKFYFKDICRLHQQHIHLSYIQAFITINQLGIREVHSLLWRIWITVYLACHMIINHLKIHTLNVGIVSSDRLSHNHV